MYLNELANEYLLRAERIKQEITGLRPLLLIYRGDRLETLKNRIWILYRTGKAYSFFANALNAGVVK